MNDDIEDKIYKAVYKANKGYEPLSYGEVGAETYILLLILAILYFLSEFS